MRLQLMTGPVATPVSQTGFRIRPSRLDGGWAPAPYGQAHVCPFGWERTAGGRGHQR